MIIIMMATFTVMMLAMTMTAHIIIVVEGIEDIIGEAGEQVNEEPGLETKRD